MLAEASHLAALLTGDLTESDREILIDALGVLEDLRSAW